MERSFRMERSGSDWQDDGRPGDHTRPGNRRSDSARRPGCVVSRGGFRLGLTVLPRYGQNHRESRMPAVPAVMVFTNVPGENPSARWRAMVYGIHGKLGDSAMLNLQLE